MNIAFYPYVGPRDQPFVMMKLGLKGTEDMKGIMAVDLDTNEVEAAVILNNWTHNAVFVHQWIDNPLVIRHGLFNETCRYVFEVCEKNLMIGMVPGDNEEALRLNKKVGFRETYRIPEGHAQGIDYVVMEATKDDLARWLRPIKRAA